MLDSAHSGLTGAPPPGNVAQQKKKAPGGRRSHSRGSHGTAAVKWSGPIKTTHLPPASSLHAYKLPLSSNQSRIAAWILIVLYLGGLAISAALRSVPFVISLLFFVIMLAWLPSVFVGTGYAFHETTEYITSLTTRVPHLSHDLYNKYNQSAAAIAVRLLTTKDGRGLCGRGVAAIAGFVFQLILSIRVVVWTLLCDASGRDTRLSLGALFCTLAAFSPVSWLEYYMALVVPYMALTFIAWSDAEETPASAKIARLVLAGALILSVSTRLFEPLLYYGAEYFGSLAVLAAIVALTRTRPSSPAKGPSGKTPSLVLLELGQVDEYGGGHDRGP